MKSTAIAKRLRAPVVKTTDQQPGAEPDRMQYNVIEPGPNPPTYVQVAKAMLNKITTNSPDIVNALITLAKNGHYQAAQYLLNEMKTLNEELKTTDEQSVVELFRPVIERLNAKYRKPTVIDVDCDDDCDALPPAPANVLDDAAPAVPDRDAECYCGSEGSGGRSSDPASNP